MAVVACVETARGTGVSGKFGDSSVFTRRWLVRVDTPQTPRAQIALAPGVVYGTSHPEWAVHKAMEFDVSEESGDGMVWGLTWRYYIPPAENTPDTTTGLPKDCWAGAGRSTTIPVFKDKDGNEILNSAGDALEGAERESTEFVLTLTKCYPNIASWSIIAASRSNTVNESNWNGSAQRTWKCEFRSAHKKEMSVNGSSPTSSPYWEVVFDFVYRAERWDYKPWDIGYNQLADETGQPTYSGTHRVAILGADKRSVKSPVALSSGIAKNPGDPPDALEFRLYTETDFSVFGNPA